MDAIKITAPGVYDVPEAVYHADDFLPAPSLSSSGAKKILNECPARFWHDRNTPDEPSEALRMGRAAHKLLLEPAAFAEQFGVLPEDYNGRTNAGKAQLAVIEESGRTAIKHDQFEAIKAMAEALKAHEFAYAAFENGTEEKTLVWFDAEFGIWCRCRPDFFPKAHAIVPDYKTTLSAAPDYLRKAMFDHGYHQQAEWYLSGVRALGLIESPRFLLIFQEKEAPYLVTCVTPSDVALQWAAIQNRKAKELFARCLRENRWPGYADNILTLDLPGWAEYRLHERKERGDFETVQRAYAPHAAAE